MRWSLLLVLVGCGRVNFGYPLVDCEDVNAATSVLWDDNDHCYTRQDLELTFDSAKDVCASLGGYVAVITTPDENDVIARIAGNGLMRFGIEYVFEWSSTTQEPLPFANWAAGEPAGCASGITYPAGLIATNGDWSTDCKSIPHAYTCEIEPWLEYGGHHYRIHWAQADWFTANANCETLGAHLVSFESVEEYMAVAGLTSAQFWLGGYSPGGGAFSWVDGAPWAFTVWNQNQPDDVGATCVSARTDKTWADELCGTGMPALCERDE